MDTESVLRRELDRARELEESAKAVTRRIQDGRTALVARWRERADSLVALDVSKTATWDVDGVAGFVRQCADELEGL